MPQNIRRSAFTTKFNARSNILISDVGISEAYDPASANPQPSVIKFNAIWDTGASGSVINQQVISKLGLQPIDKKEVHTANGKRNASVYLVNIYLPNQVAFLAIRVTDGDILGSSVLIGMDIIGSGDFAVTHSDGKTCMSFQMPPNMEIDFVKEINESKQRQNIRPAKNKSRRNRQRKPWDNKRLH